MDPFINDIHDVTIFAVKTPTTDAAQEAKRLRTALNALGDQVPFKVALGGRLVNGEAKEFAIVTFPRSPAERDSIAEYAFGEFRQLTVLHLGPAQKGGKREAFLETRDGGVERLGFWNKTDRVGYGEWFTYDPHLNQHYTVAA